MNANGAMATWWSTRPLSLYSAAGSTSELPMSDVPSATFLIPVPEPPAVTLIVTLGFFSINSVAACLTNGRSALDPEAVTVPDNSVLGASLGFAEAEAAVVAAAVAAALFVSVFAPQPTKVPIINTADSVNVIPFFDMKLNIVNMSSFECMCWIWLSSIPIFLCVERPYFPMVTSECKIQTHET
ncbi:hypothetical protein D3C85_1275650 [compost metagenome]